MIKKKKCVYQQYVYVSKMYLCNKKKIYINVRKKCVSKKKNFLNIGMDSLDLHIATK